MELRQPNTVPTSANDHPCQSFERTHPIWLEKEEPEETQIRDLEKKISDHQSLINEKKKIYDSWIARIDREIGQASKDDKPTLQRKRDRIVQDYGAEFGKYSS